MARKRFGPLLQRRKDELAQAKTFLGDIMRNGTAVSLSLSLPVSPCCAGGAALRAPLYMPRHAVL